MRIHCMKHNHIAPFFKSLLIVFVLLAGCSKDTPTTITPVPAPDVPVVPPSTGGTLTVGKYLALGDSYTIGQNVASEERFPAQTVKLLQQNGVNVNSLVYIAATGWTTNSLLSAINSATLQPPYDLVSLLIGVNDQYQTRDTTNYRSRFTTLLNKAIELSGNRPARVFVVSIPDYSVTPFVQDAMKEQVSKEIEWFNNINREVTIARNISYTDITPSSREAATNRSLIASDGLHPSGLEYMKWAAMLAPKMKAAL